MNLESLSTSDLYILTKHRTPWGNLNLDSLLYEESNFACCHTQKNFLSMLAPSMVTKNKVHWPAPCPALSSLVGGSLSTSDALFCSLELLTCLCCFFLAVVCLFACLVLCSSFIISHTDISLFGVTHF